MSEWVLQHHDGYGMTYYVGMTKTVMGWFPEISYDIRKAMTFRTKAEAVSYGRHVKAKLEVARKEQK